MKKNHIDDFIARFTRHNQLANLSLKQWLPGLDNVAALIKDLQKKYGDVAISGDSPKSRSRLLDYKLENGGLLSIRILNRKDGVIVEYQLSNLSLFDQALIQRNQIIAEFTTNTPNQPEN